MKIYEFLKDSKAFINFSKKARAGVLPHAAIVYCRDEFTLRAMLKLFACAALCEMPQRPCLGCRTCDRVLKEVHPDCLIYPKKGGRISAEDTGRIIGEVSLRPCEGDRKVFLLMYGESMLPSAQNKLLKTLEEPEEPAYIFIGASNIESLLPTVRSRCALFEVELFSAEKIFAFLSDYCPAGSNKVAASSCGGLVGKAIEMAMSSEYLEVYNHIYGMLDHLKRGDDVLDYSRLFSTYKDKQEVLDIMQLYFRDLLMAKRMGRLRQDKQAGLEKAAASRTERQLIRYIEMAGEAKRKLQLNCSAEAVFEDILSEIASEED